MENFVSGGNWRRSGRLPIRRWRVMTWTGIALLSMSFAGCQTPREPYDCGNAEMALRGYAYEYNRCLEDKGNLRQQLKSCQERR